MWCFTVSFVKLLRIPVWQNIMHSISERLRIIEMGFMTQTKNSIDTFSHRYALKFEAFAHVEIEITHYCILFVNLLTQCVAEAHAGNTLQVIKLAIDFVNLVKSIF